MVALLVVIPFTNQHNRLAALVDGNRVAMVVIHQVGNGRKLGLDVELEKNLAVHRGRRRYNAVPHLVAQPHGDGIAARLRRGLPHDEGAW